MSKSINQKIKLLALWDILLHNVDTKPFTQPNAHLYADTDAQAQTIAVFRQSL